ncbi:gas vesicle protein GvpL [Halogeometricum limi]|uniref:Gas vesicle synthesis protein GvpL/GvpF n=1 Tax=Halogeometricum limi TaxID=555875 RepID=A0A1I6GU83_9EURY|nr:GvpL/GvpF family gas vesicle protein [Halogeometricum limi]SFR45805.1 Gas vesicle synthesis protein GvpL/GvpF [Halogeometricum limi]
MSSDDSGGGDESASSTRNGRYLYCVVRRDDDAAASFDVSGVDGAPLTLVSAGGLSAVVHDRDEPYESDETTQVRDWLYDHQSAVERVGETFGTPVPFRFDTIVRGGDEAVRAWLDANAETLNEALTALDGRWEYRVEVEWDREALVDRLTEDDERLAELDDRLADASEGTAFLVEKQYDRRVSELVTERRRTRSASLDEELRRRTAEVVELGDAPQTPLTETPSGPTARFAVLADDDERDAVGSYLDTIADEDGASVRYTGPWPPYTFAPDACAPTGEDGPGPAE